MSYWGGTAIGAVDKGGSSQNTTHQIYSNASGEYALGIRSDATVGRGVFIRAGSNDNYESLLVTSYDENDKRFAIMGGGTVIFGEDGSGNLGVDPGTRYQFNGGKLFVTGSKDGDYITEIRNEDADNGYGLRVSAGDDNNVIALAVANKDQSTKFVVTGAGNVGIGTNVPDRLLHVHGAGGGQAVAVFEDTSANANVLIQAPGSDKNSILNFGDAGSTEIGQIDYDHNDNSMRFVTNASEAVRITSAGKVGIGTNSPSAPLHVSGANDTTFASSAGGSPANLFLQGSNSYDSGYSGGGIFFLGEYQSGANTAFAAVSGIKENTTSGQYGGAVTFFTRTNGSGAGAAERMRISSTGNVGIGTNSPSQPLHIKSATPSILFTDSSNGELGYIGDGADFLTSNSITDADTFGIRSSGAITFGTNGNNGRMVITSAGNVGIRTATPSFHLEVNGTFYSAGSSREYKEDISDLEIDSSLIYNLRPVSYNLKDEFKHLGYDLGGDKQLGLISEEVNDIIPELAIIKDGKPKNVDYEKLSILLLKEVQNLRVEIDNLKKVQ